MDSVIVISDIADVNDTYNFALLFISCLIVCFVFAVFTYIGKNLNC